MKEVAKQTLYVSDMDGTLMSGDSRLSARTVSILNDLIAHRGMLFTVATARTTATVVSLMRDVHTTLPYIVLSGAALWDDGRQCFEQTQAIDPLDVRRICDICERHGVHPFVYRRHGNVLHTHRYGAMTDFEADFVEARCHTPYKRFILDDPNYHTSDDETLLIFSMQRNEALVKAHTQIVAEVNCEAICYRDNNDPSLVLLEVYAPGCNKAAAATRLKQRLGVERMVAFGDNLNDLPLLHAADHSVAVANAFPEVRAQVDEVIGPNTDDSVALFLMNNGHALPAKRP